MKATFHDRREILLGAIKPGQIAIAARGDGAFDVFTKVKLFNAGAAIGEWLIDLNRLDSQYHDKISANTRVRLLEKGESIEFTQT